MSMPNLIDSPIRDKPPCKGCEKDVAKPQCHDTCPEYARWKAEVDRVNENRRNYGKLPFSKIM